jgi:hypothetical protein
LVTRISALRQARGLEAAEEFEATFAEADAWLEMSGAKSYEPFLHVEHAELARLVGDEVARQRELREAHRLFLEIGAPIRAGRNREKARRMKCSGCGHENRDAAKFCEEYATPLGCKCARCGAAGSFSDAGVMELQARYNKYGSTRSFSQT